MMLLMTVMAASAVFTWYQNFQQQQLQQVSKRAASLAQNMQFSITDAKWKNPYTTTKHFVANVSGTLYDVNVTYATFYVVIQNTGDDIDLNSKDPLSQMSISELATGQEIAMSTPGVLYVGETQDLTTYPIDDQEDGQTLQISNPVVIDNLLNFTANGVQVLSPIACYRLVLENLGHPANIVRSGETARLQCVLITNVTTSDSTNYPVNDFSPVNYDLAKTYQVTYTYGTTSQSTQLFK